MDFYFNEEIIHDSDFLKIYDKCRYINYTKNIKARRIYLDYSQEKIAEMCGLSRIGYSNIEKGISAPSMITMMSIVRNLKIDLDSAFLDYVGQPKNQSHVDINNVSLMQNKVCLDIQKITVTTLNRLIDEYTKSEEQQDISSTILWCMYTNSFFDLKSNPNNLRELCSSTKAFEIEEFERYITNKCKEFERYHESIVNEEVGVSTKRQTPQRMFSIMNPVQKVTVIILMIFGLMFSAQVVAYALGYDLLQIITEWGESLFSAPYNTEITRDNITVVKSKSGYATVDDAVSDLRVGLLYPMYLPDDNALTSINNSSTSENVSLFYRFKNTGASFVVMSYTNDVMNSVKTESIGGFDCLVSDNPSSGHAQVNFVYNDMLYTVGCADYDELVRIVENLGYLDYQ